MAAGYTPTPDYYRDYIQHGMMQMSEDEYLEHYGVKGMKWRKHLKGAKAAVTGRIKQRLYNGEKKRTYEDRQKYVQSHIVQDIKDRKATIYGSHGSSLESHTNLDNGLAYNYTLRADLEREKSKKLKRKKK